MHPGLPYRFNETQISSRKSQLKKVNMKKGQKPNTSLSSHPHTYYHQQNINDQLMQNHQRKENYLNSKYNKRLVQLKKITQDNKKIYERINSQKSLYSQKDQQKSYDSLRSISRCSSRSKNGQDSKTNTQKNTFRNSFRMANKTKYPKKQTNNVTIQSQSVNKVTQSNLKDFQKIFFQNQQNYGKLSNKQPNQNRSLSLRPDKKSSNGMGNMLHKIAEEMYGSQKKTVRKILY